MEEEKLSAEGLVQASENWEDDPVPPDVGLFRSRMRELHDLSHVVTGYGRDPLGELCLLTFTYRQFGNLGRLLIVAMAWSQIPRPGRAAVFEAWRNGKSCGWLGDRALSPPTVSRRSIGRRAPSADRAAPPRPG